MSQAAFPPTSRYHGVELAAFERPGEAAVAYVRRRFIAPPEQFALLQEYRVAAGDRLDLIAAHFLGEPDQFWRICDANGALTPEELEQPGAVVRITLPQGIPGAQ
ncbi:MAG: LysM peptidoglycan-binding domain-containing protein [Chloroflexi bacterium]|nr:LysM peptidoglycan-binding domain-containing protein [Chloroflexota bacterium]